MSQDIIIGTAILRRREGNVDWLHHLRQYGVDGLVCNFSLPMVPAAEYETWKTKVNFPVWQYTIEGDILHGSPSIRSVSYKNREWHNTYNWSVKFVVDYKEELSLKELNPVYYQPPWEAYTPDLCATTYQRLKT